MPKIALSYEKEEEVPEQHKELYTETEGVWNLTEITGLRTDEEFSVVTKSLAESRADGKKIKKVLQLWGDLKPEETHALLDEIEELKAFKEVGDGKLSDDQIEELVAKRIGRQVSPLQRKLQTAEDQLKDVLADNMELNALQVTGALNAESNKVAAECKIVPHAYKDVSMNVRRLFELDDNGEAIAKSGNESEVQPGIPLKLWMGDQQSLSPHWFGQTVGTGAQGSGSSAGISGSDNPWTLGGWNLTTQVKMVQEDKAKADKYAKAAGTRVGGPKPEK